MKRIFLVAILVSIGMHAFAQSKNAKTSKKAYAHLTIKNDCAYEIYSVKFYDANGAVWDMGGDPNNTIRPGETYYSKFNKSVAIHTVTYAFVKDKITRDWKIEKKTIGCRTSLFVSVRLNETKVIVLNGNESDCPGQ